MKIQFDTLHEKGWFKSLAALIALMVGIAGLVTVLSSWFHDRPIAVINQETVIEPQHSTHVQKAVAAKPEAPAPEASGPRTLDDAFKQRLLQELSDKDASVTVMCVRQDPEAAKYTQEILSFLKSQHYNVGLAYVGFPPSFHGTEIDKQGRHTFVKIGRNS